MSTFISREQDLLPRALVAVTVIVRKEVTEEEGVPEMTPEAEFNDNPESKDPLEE